MKNTNFTIVLLTLLANFSYGQQVQEKSVYTYANSTMIEKILDIKEIEYESIDFNTYKMELDGFNVIASIDDGDLILKTYFSNKPSLNRINDFNAQYRWARAYIDVDGGLTVAEELSFSGGITIQNISTFLNTFGEILDEFVKQMR